MRFKNLVVQNEYGLHVRVASRVVQKIKALKSKVIIFKGCKKANGCSILQLLMLCATKGSEIQLKVSGENEELTLIELTELFSQGSGI
jgi:phosphocarrier protein HPr